jgi:hypothetical protein
MRRQHIVVASSFFVAGLLVGLGFSYLYFLGWVKAYPNPDDPKNIDYVLWTKGLNKNINLDAAMAAMVHDRDPGRVVRGLNRAELRARFGYIREFGEATPYLQACPSGHWPGAGQRGKDVAFLRDSPWMAVLKDGRVDQLVLCKGY